MVTPLNSLKAFTDQNKTHRVAVIIAAVCLLICTYAAAPFAFASAGAVIEGVVKIVSMICNVVGVIFVLIGIVKIAISHANEDGPAQQKAALMIATGIILVVLGATKILGIDFAGWLTS